MYKTAAELGLTEIQLIALVHVLLEMKSGVINDSNFDQDKRSIPNPTLTDQISMENHANRIFPNAFPTNFLPQNEGLHNLFYNYDPPDNLSTFEARKVLEQFLMTGDATWPSPEFWACRIGV